MKVDPAVSILIALLVLVATASGILYQTTEPRIEYATVRGEQATFQGGGLYRYDPVSVAREGIVWDAVSLLFGLPLFFIAITLARGRSIRGRLMLLGMLFYFFYMYLMYATMVAFNQMFLVYVAIFALSGVMFFRNLMELDVVRLAGQIPEKFPYRLLIGFTASAGILLILLWMKLTVSIMMDGRFPREIAGMTTLETQAMDLGIIVPLMLSTAFLLRQRSPWGYLLAGVSITFGFMMCLTIPAWIAVPLIQDGKIQLIEAVPFLALSAMGLYVALRFFKSVPE
jgi:hypothetical protein